MPVEKTMVGCLGHKEMDGTWEDDDGNTHPFLPWDDCILIASRWAIEQFASVCFNGSYESYTFSITVTGHEWEAWCRCDGEDTPETLVAKLEESKARPM